jgi:exopolyphosphatase
VDHNAFGGDWAGIYGGRVVGCVDHHVDEGKLPSNCGPEPRVIEKCGSCASLVVEYCRPAWEALRSSGGSGETLRVDSHLAHVALAAILADTINLTSKDKTTDKDITAVSFLEPLAGKDYTRDKYFEELSSVKEDISALNFRDIFRKDYKQWRDGSTSLGVSCVVQNLEYLTNKAGSEEVFLKELKSWALEKKLDIVVVMTMAHPDDQFRRELLFWALSPGAAISAAHDFAARCKEELQLEPWADGKFDQADGHNQWRRAWKQHNISGSRKQVAPLIRESMKLANHL